MSNKPGLNEKLNNFFAGKGFYIVLSLCVAVIGVSAYFLIANRGTYVDGAADTAIDNGIRQETVLPKETPQAVPPQTGGVPANEDPEDLSLRHEEPDDQPAVIQEQPQDAPVWNEQQAQAAAGAQFIWPLEGKVSLPYSVTALVYHEKLGDWRTHDGLEISAPLGTQVQAVSTGKVEHVGFDDLEGMTVIIEHAGGVRSIYSNLAAVPTVYEGDNVMTGEVIGSVGTTAPGEAAENPTLHLKMTLDGHSVNPVEYLPPR